MAEAAALALWEVGTAWATEAAIFAVSNAAAINTVLAITASTAYGQHQRSKAQAAARAAYNASLKDREVMIRSAVAPRRKIYGRDLVSGPIVYACTSGDRNEHLHLVIALAGHECDAIEQVYFNDVLLPAPDASGDILSGPFALASEAEGGYEGMTDAAGSLALPTVPSGISACTAAAVDGIGQDSLLFSWTPGTSLVTGLSPSRLVSVSYRTGAVMPKVRIRKYLGGAGQVADADLIAASGGAWTSAHVGVGICYLYVRLTYDQDVFGSIGVPQIRAMVRGAKCYDPRTGETVWTENDALIAADWLRDQTMGLGASADEVPNTEVAAAANICDELVHLGGAAYEARYTFNGSITSDQTPRAALSDLLSAMAGTCVWAQGRWLIRPGAYRTPALTLTEDDLAGSSVRIVPRAARADLFNAVRVTHRDTAQAWAEVQAPLVTSATYEGQDGGVRITRSVSHPSAMESTRAQRLGKIELERARQAVAVELVTSLRGYNLLPTDTVTLQLRRYGWSSGKVFEVRSRSFDTAAGQVTYQLRETAAAVWDWAYGEATVVDPAPDTDLPNPYIPPAAPVISTLETGTAHLLAQADGTLITRAWLAWPALTDRFVTSGGHLELQWRPSTITTWTSEPDLPGSATGAYIANLPDGQAIIVRLRAVNAAGRASAWAYEAERVIGKTAAPSNVSGTAVAVGKGRAVWSWALPADADWDVIEVRASDANWGSLAVPALFRGRASQWAESVTAAGSLTRYMRHIDTSGNVSAATTVVSVTVTTAQLLGALSALDQVDTAQIVSGAATDLYTDIYDYAGAGFGSRTFSYTPTADCTIEFTAKAVASGVYGDAAHYLGWYVSIDGGSDVLIDGAASSSTAKQEFAGVGSFGASAGVALTFKLQASVPAFDPAIRVWATTMRVTAIKR